MDDEQATRIDIARDAAHEDEVARAETGRSRRDARREPQIPADDPPRFIAGARIAAGRTQPDFGDAGMGGQRRLQPIGQYGIAAPLGAQNLEDRKSVVWGKSVAVRVDLGGGSY